MRADELSGEGVDCAARNLLPRCAFSASSSIVGRADSDEDVRTRLVLTLSSQARSLGIDIWRTAVSKTAPRPAGKGTSMRILLADEPGPLIHLTRALQPFAELPQASNYGVALALLSDHSLDAIIVGVHFSGSQMFNLVKAAKAQPHLKGVPLICVRLLGSILSLPMLSAVDVACRSLGVRYVDVLSLIPDLGSEAADGALGRLLLAAISEDGHDDLATGQYENFLTDTAQSI